MSIEHKPTNCPHKIDLDLLVKELPVPDDASTDDGTATQDDIENMLRELEG